MTTLDSTSTARPRSLQWRVVDIVVAAVIAVASAFVFSLWDLVYQLPSSVVGAVLPGFQGLINGPWLFAGVLAGVVIRKPGAALFAELVAATIEALVGSQWGPLTLASGATQGLGAELVFAVLLYRVWSPWTAVLAGAGAALLGAVNDLFLFYADVATPAYAAVYVATGVVSGAVIAGLLSWLVARALARTGVLSRFASGREVTAEV